MYNYIVVVFVLSSKKCNNFNTLLEAIQFIENRNLKHYHLFTVHKGVDEYVAN